MWRLQGEASCVDEILSNQDTFRIANNKQSHYTKGVKKDQDSYFQ
jgi:hypothetical protein